MSAAPSQRSSRADAIDPTLESRIPAAARPSDSTLPVSSAPSAEPEAPRGHLPVLASRYQMLNIIGYGSYGMVFRGHDLEARESVAIKILKSECYGDDFIERLWEREQSLVKELNIRGAPRGFDAGNDTVQGSRVSYLVCELVNGQTLKDWRQDLREEPTAASILDLTRRIVEALCELAELGVIHRDIKPGNIMRTEAGTIKIMDFGLHLLADEPTPERSDKMIGTPQYMPPELIVGQAGSFASDIYSLGCTLYFLIEGQPPYRGEHVARVLQDHRSKPLPRLEEPWRGSRLEELLFAMTRKDPDKRLDIREVLTQLIEDDGLQA